MTDEIWFIYSPAKEPWANLRIATFTRAHNEPELEIVIIHNETPDRTGPRVWPDIVERERWFKVSKIDVPTADDVRRHGPLT